MNTIRINQESITYSPGMEVHIVMLAWAQMHAGARVTWPDGRVNWYKEVGTQLWLHTLQVDGKTSAQQVR